MAQQQIERTPEELAALRELAVSGVSTHDEFLAAECVLASYQESADRAQEVVTELRRLRETNTTAIRAAGFHDLGHLRTYLQGVLNANQS